MRLAGDAPGEQKLLRNRRKKSLLFVRRLNESRNDEGSEENNEKSRENKKTEDHEGK